jgi:uncharacterized protein involved in copper resistance
VSAYRLIAPGKYEYQILEDNGSLFNAVGLQGMADYRFEDEKLIVTTFLDDERDRYKHKTTAVYVRDRPRLDP